MITFKQQLDIYEKEWESLLEEHNLAIFNIKAKIKEITKKLEDIDAQFVKDSNMLESEYKSYCSTIEKEKQGGLLRIEERLQEELSSLERRREDARLLSYNERQEKLEKALKPIDQQISMLDAELVRLQKKYEEVLSSSSEDLQRLQSEFNKKIESLEIEVNAKAEKLIQVEFNLFIESLSNTDEIVLATSSIKDKISHICYQILQYKEDLKLHSAAQPSDVQFALQELSDFKKRYQLLKPHLVVERERVLNESLHFVGDGSEELYDQEKQELLERYDILKKHFAQMHAESNEYEIKLAKLKERYEVERGKTLNIIADLQAKLEQENKRFNDAEKSFILEVKKSLDALLKVSFDLKGKSSFAETLPESVAIGGIPNRVENSKLLKKIYGVSSVDSSTPININLRSDMCNIVIDVDEDADDDRLNSVIAGLALKYLEEFPIGALKLSLVDTLGVDGLRPLIKTFENSSVLLAKNMVRDGYIADEGRCKTYFEAISRTITDELYGKVSSGDIYKAFDNDPTGTQIHLVIIRSGMTKWTEYNSGFVANKIAELSRSPKYGFRFIIVNDSKKSCRAMADIYEHAVRIKYKDGIFSQNSKGILLTTVRGNNIFTEVQDECKLLVKSIEDKAKEVEIIPYEKVGFGRVSAEKCTDAPQIAINIPIGLIDGKTPFSMEFACRAINGRTIICYTVLGKTSSGKSSLLHSMVINGCMKYSPNDLIFWLFDFKNNKTSNEYKDSGIPHIQFVQESKEDNPYMVSDLYNLLRLVSKEMSARSKIIREAKSIADQHGIEFKDETIADYNYFVDTNTELLKKYPEKKFHHMPRLVIAFDEPNQVYKMTNSTGYKKIDNIYSNLTTQIRINGIHFVHFVHTIRGGEYQESYVKNSQGKICFGMEDGDNTLGQELHGMGDEFSTHQHEITGLGAGECYVRKFDSNALQKVKICFAPNGLKEYKDRIVKSPTNIGYNSNILVLGKDCELLPSDEVQTQRSLTQAQLMSILSKQNWRIDGDFSSENCFEVLIGEDCYNLKPIKIDFNSSDIGGLAVCGKNELMKYSIFSSILLQVHSFGFETHICLTKHKTNFGKLCDELRVEYSKNEVFISELEKVYSIYLQRKSEESLDGDDIKKPIFLFVDDLNVLLKTNAMFFSSGTVLSQEDSKPRYVAQSTEGKIPQIKNTGYNTNNKFAGPSKAGIWQTTKSLDNISIKNAIDEIAKLGAQQGIYLVVGANGSETAPYLLHPSMRLVFIGQADGQKEILAKFNSNYDLKAGIQEALSETTEAKVFALFANQTAYTKFRPIIYSKGDLLKQAIKEVCNA